jgi:predicted flavoprotein YhiN
MDFLHLRACELSAQILAHRQQAVLFESRGLTGSAHMQRSHAVRKEEQVRWIAEQCLAQLARRCEYVDLAPGVSASGAYPIVVAGC